MIHYIPDYEDHLKQKGLSTKHIRDTATSLYSFFNYCGGLQTCTITRALILSYRDYLAHDCTTQRGVPPSAGLIQHRLSALKGFCQYLTQRGIFLTNPAKDLAHSSTARCLPSYVPAHDEVKRMIDSIPAVGTGMRDKAILELLYSSGLRAGELLQLSLYDVDFNGRRVLVRRGKGAKDRVVPLGEKAALSLREYIDEVRASWIARTRTNCLFIRRSGKEMRHKHLMEVIHKYREHPKLTPHTLRHACAVGMMRNGADIRFIQELLGHKKLETTQVYTQLAPIEVKKAHSRFHPRRFLTPERRELGSKTKKLWFRAQHDRKFRAYLRLNEFSQAA